MEKKIRVSPQTFNPHRNAFKPSTRGKHASNVVQDMAQQKQEFQYLPVTDIQLLRPSERIISIYIVFFKGCHNVMAPAVATWTNPPVHVNYQISVHAPVEWEILATPQTFS